VLKSGSNAFHGSAYEYNEVSTTGCAQLLQSHGELSAVHEQLLRRDYRWTDRQGSDILLR
jgi:hypothetical protein